VQPTDFSPRAADPDEEWASPIRSGFVTTGISYEVWQDGLVLFAFGEEATIGAWSDVDWERTLIERASVCNVHLACLHSAIPQGGITVAKRAVSVTGTVREYRSGAGDSRFGSHDRVVAAHLPIPGREVSAWALGGEATLATSFLHTRRLVPAESIGLSMEYLASVLHGGPLAISLVELLLKGCSALELENYTDALVALWTAAEVAISTLTESAVDHLAGVNGGVKPRKPDRWGAARSIEFLGLLGVLDITLIKEIDAVRVARNRWLHGLLANDRELAATALLTATALVSSVVHVPLLLRAADERGRL
jgi:hypothetical protein